MKYRIVVPKKVQKDLSKIDARNYTRTLSVLIALADNPFIGKKLKGKRNKEWSYRVWPYRIIYQIKNKELVVLIIRIGHRGKVYK